MTGDQTASLIYLGLLTTVIAGGMLLSGRANLGKMTQHAVTWGLIFLGVIAAIGLWDDIRTTVIPQQSTFSDTGQIVIPQSPDGHYYVTARVNGTPIRFVVDTGATSVVLTNDDAARAGFAPEDLAFFGQAYTANGPVRTAPVRLDRLAIGEIEERDLRAFVSAGEMQESLLGMTYLQRFEKIEITGGELVLTR